MNIDQDMEYLQKYIEEDKLKEGIKLLKKGVPVQYIVGNVDFYGNVIKVNSNTLIPRFETELLVEKTVKYIDKYFSNDVRILDIGTGSGCIAITLAKLVKAVVDASDISDKALEVAMDNAICNDVKVNFILSDVFSNIKDKYDIIVSNPPYISYDEEIMDKVRDYEPHLALYALDDGLYFYDKILRECPDFLNDKFLIAFEIGYKQSNRIIEMAYKYLGNVRVWCEKDYSGRDRFIFITNVD